jgi:hypothetical protein
MDEWAGQTLSFLRWGTTHRRQAPPNETQGNTTNTSPEPQDLECTQDPATSNGKPIVCP